MGCHSLLQGIFLTQELNLGLLQWQTVAGGFFSAESPGKRYIQGNLSSLVLGHPRQLAEGVGCAPGPALPPFLLVMEGDLGEGNAVHGEWVSESWVGHDLPTSHCQPKAPVALLVT